MSLLGEGGLPGVKPSDVVIGTNQVRVRAPAAPGRAWPLTQAIVARFSAAEPAHPDDDQGQSTDAEA
jgi:hypothetical protein